MNRKIHFISLFCIDYDMDLFDYWTDHYTQYGFDHYSVWLNSPKNNHDGLLEASKKFEAKGFTVLEIIDSSEQFLDGRMRMKRMDAYHMSCDKNDMIVCADSDEFHNITGDYIHILHEYDVVMGKLVDRWGANLVDAVSGVPLYLQYPVKGNFEKVICTGMTPEQKNFWPFMKKEKILASRGDILPAYGGSHSVYEMPASGKICPNIFDVDHYTWRSTIIGRLAGKSYFIAPHIWEILKYFNMTENPPKEFWDAANEYDRMQEKKGWVSSID